MRIVITGAEGFAPVVMENVTCVVLAAANQDTSRDATTAMFGQKVEMVALTAAVLAGILDEFPENAHSMVAFDIVHRAISQLSEKRVTNVSDQIGRTPR